MSFLTPLASMINFDQVRKIDFWGHFAIFGLQPVEDDPPTHISRKRIFSGDLNARIEKVRNCRILKILPKEWWSTAIFEHLQMPEFGYEQKYPRAKPYQDPSEWLQKNSRLTRSL